MKYYISESKINSHNKESSTFNKKNQVYLTTLIALNISNKNDQIQNYNMDIRETNNVEITCIKKD